MIHPTAIVSPKAQLGENVKIGPYSIVGDGVELGDDCILHAHVIVDGPSKFGRANEFFPFAAVGGLTQDLKYSGEPTWLEVGDRNTFRENTTIHRGTHEHTPTQIGSDNLFLCGTHVAHDCRLGDHIIISNNSALAGHITVEDHAIIAGFTAVHQFCRIGCHAMIGGCSRISQDVPPYMMVEGHTPATRGLNLVGLQRRGFTEDDIRALKNAYKKIFLKKDTNLSVSLSSLKADTPANNPHVKHLIAFIEASQRGVTR